MNFSWSPSFVSLVWDCKWDPSLFFVGWTLLLGLLAGSCGWNTLLRILGKGIPSAIDQITDCIVIFVCVINVCLQSLL